MSEEPKFIGLCQFQRNIQKDNKLTSIMHIPVGDMEGESVGVTEGISVGETDGELVGLYEGD